MNFTKIDLDAWHRRKTYRHYMDDSPCTYNLCVNLDITGLLPKLEAQKVKLFPTVLYAIARTVNAHSEFRMDFDKNQELGYYDIVHPCYTVFHPESESFFNVWTEYKPSFGAFYSEYLADTNQCKNKLVDKPQEPTNVFNVSCIPWTSFTGFNLNLPHGHTYLLPIFTVGKFFTAEGKTLLPLAVQAHHAICDGFHTARLLEEIQDWLDNFPQ